MLKHSWTSSLNHRGVIIITATLVLHSTRHCKAVGVQLETFSKTFYQNCTHCYGCRLYIRYHAQILDEDMT